MILSTTPQIEGHTIREYKGIVTGETIIGANMFKDLFAGIRDIVGGRAGAYEKVLSEAKDTSMQEMMQRAQALGANAVVGIDIDYETVGANGSMLMVATSGTAVVIYIRSMKSLGNIIWVIFGGLHIALEYFIAGLILMITIIGIPFGLQSLKLGMLAIWPFGTKVKWRESQPGCLSIFMNVLWFFVGGIWIWLTHIFYGLIFCITIIGIPFGKMHFRLAKLALSPFGKEVV